MKTPIAELYTHGEHLACRPEDIQYAAAVIQYALTADPRIIEFRTKFEQLQEDPDSTVESFMVGDVDFDQKCLSAFTVIEMEAYCHALHITFIETDNGWHHTIRCVASPKDSKYFFGWTNHSDPFPDKDSAIMEAFLIYVIKDN